MHRAKKKMSYKRTCRYSSVQNSEYTYPNNPKKPNASTIIPTNGHLIKTSKTPPKKSKDGPTRLPPFPPKKTMVFCGPIIRAIPAINSTFPIAMSPLGLVLGFVPVKEGDYADKGNEKSEGNKRCSDF